MLTKAKETFITILNKKVLSEGKFLRFVLASYVDSSGITRNWELFERINCNGIVAIVPVTDEGNVLLIRQFRPPVNGYVIEFPAGLNDKGDTLQRLPGENSAKKPDTCQKR